WSIALLQLRSGDFENGWKGYEWRWQLKDELATARFFSQPRWDGSDISGKTVLLHSEQGFGDTIQFARYAPLVADLGATVIIECQRELVSLLRSVKGVHTVIARDDEAPPFDIHCPLLSLPSVFGTKLETIPGKVPYISADQAAIQLWRDKIISAPAAPRIGLAWSGNPKKPTDRFRSCPLDAFIPLSGVGDITFFSLQKGAAARQAGTLSEDLKILDYTDKINDFSDTAALVQNLDLVITVDTAVAHLAGALGKPVWILLPFVSDWRWMRDREDSPWYPTMRLFRQRSSGDWESVMSRVSECLREFVSP
ncbi:MAG TPA: glycosyltransferase family 9 protein, partial [Thermodesulfovibrionales bacterium]|nr:glycosyltransferase family 9 protein [Thermodesulfovibrionales bacterium]